MKILLPAGLAAVATAAVIAATATGQSTPSTTTLKFVQTDKSFGYVDAPPKGGERKPPSSGDEYVIGGTLSADGKPAGTDGLVCTVTTPGKAAADICTGTAVIPGGTLTFSGISRAGTNADTFAVTGGTGTYAGARGSIVGAEGKHDTTNITATLLG